MKRLVFILFLFLSIQAQAQQDTLLRVLVWGLWGSPENLEDGVAKKYGFEYYSVGGCVIPWHLDDSVRKHNDSVNAILSQKYGKNWQERVWEEVEDIRTHKEELKTLVLGEPAVAAKHARTVLYMEIEPTFDKDRYKVRVFGYDAGDWKLFYTYHVHRTKKKASLLQVFTSIPGRRISGIHMNIPCAYGLFQGLLPGNFAEILIHEVVTPHDRMHDHHCS